MSTLQTEDEVKLAELLLEIHPWAHNARFTRSGGETMAAAVRIARASTGRDQLAICGYHGWHDWYLAANLREENSDENHDQLKGHLLPGLEPQGVPAGLTDTAHTFHYNRLDELDAVIKKHGRSLAAIVMEPTRQNDPAPGFLEGVRERCDQIGAKLIFDEISIGWRLCLGGAHLIYGVEPDIAVFAKALGNGFPIGAVIGHQDTMKAAQKTFLSSTFWTEGVGPAAALACINKMRSSQVSDHLNKIGSLVMNGWCELAKKHQLPATATGRPEGAHLSFNHPQAVALTTLLTAEMLKRGFLAGEAFNAMLAHEPRHVDKYLAALDEVFLILKTAISSDTIHSRIGGPVKHTGFTRLT